MGKIVVVANHKGGVGKTTVVYTLGLGLAHRGYKVIMVDLDAQATLTQGALGFDPAPGAYNLLVRGVEFAEVVKQIPYENYAIDGKQAPGLAALIPGNGETRHVADSVSDVTLILNKFQPLMAHVDFVIFDTSPTESLLHPVTYVASDYVLHPTIAEDWSIASLRKSMSYVQASQAYRKGLGLAETKTLGIVPVNVRPKTFIHKKILEELRTSEDCGSLVWRDLPQRIFWSEAASFKKPVFAYEPDSEAALDAWELIDTFERMIR